MARKLGPDEVALWRRVAATIRPLDASDGDTGAFDERPPRPRHAPQAPLQREMDVASGRPGYLGDSLDGGWERRLRGGSVEPDSTLDLHGLNLEAAWTAVDRLLERSWRSRHRIVLLITGRERKDSDISGRGRIRAAVRDWLAASRHAGHIAAVRPAHRCHGGSGSLYIILRRH